VMGIATLRVIGFLSRSKRHTRGGKAASQGDQGDIHVLDGLSAAPLTRLSIADTG